MKKVCCSRCNVNIPIEKAENCKVCNRYLCKGCFKKYGACEACEKELKCKGCKHEGKYEYEIEFGYNSPCTGCQRRCKDNYEEEKETEQEEHPVWKILNKEKYTEEGQKQMEEMYDDMLGIYEMLDRSDIKVLYKYMNELNHEFFAMLAAGAEGRM